jgi:hypothetical protein
MANIRLGARRAMPDRLSGIYTEEEFQALPKWKRTELHNPNRKKGRVKIQVQKWEYYIKVKYGISEQDYWALYEAQGGVCAICHKVETTKRNPSVNYKNSTVRRLCIDHDHKTGIVRGLLCNHCNSILGHALDDATTLASAINYLSKNGAEL